MAKINNESVVFIDPHKIDIMEGFNQRIDFGDINELAAQIKESHGNLEPITVIPYKADENSEIRYKLFNGERRYRAIMKLLEDGEEISGVKAIFLDGDVANMSDADLYAQQVLRNEGKKFNDVELGRVCRRMKDAGLSNSEIATKLGKNPGVITYALQSLDYDPRIREMIEKGEIGGTEVRRMYTAARKKYGDDWQEKANEEILALKEKAATKTSEGKQKVSIKNNDLYGDVKDTKVFVAGMRVLKQYIEHYKRAANGVKIDINIFKMADALGDNAKLTLRDLFDDALKSAYKAQA